MELIDELLEDATPEDINDFYVERWLKLENWNYELGMLLESR